MSVNVYKRQSVKSGWTRVDLLLEIYDRAIVAFQNCEAAHEQSDKALFDQNMIAAQKGLLAIHSGLKPEEDEVAFNVARLLLFAADSLENKQFKNAIKVLEELRNGFSAVADEVNQMEREGTIPSFPDEAEFVS